MNGSGKKTTLIAGICLATAAGLGAYGAHGLEEVLDPESVETFGIAVQYQFYHGLGMLGLGLLRTHHPESSAFKLSTVLMLAGIVLFCGSLYLLPFVELGLLGLAAPIGGTCLIAAWLALAYGAYRAASA